MRLSMQSPLWYSLGLDDPRRYNVALSCFYLGKGVEETRVLVGLPPDHPDVLYVIETAAFAGLSPADSIVRI